MLNRRARCSSLPLPSCSACRKRADCAIAMSLHTERFRAAAAQLPAVPVPSGQPPAACRPQGLAGRAAAAGCAIRPPPLLLPLMRVLLRLVPPSAGHGAAAGAPPHDCGCMSGCWAPPGPCNRAPLHRGAVPHAARRCWAPQPPPSAHMLPTPAAAHHGCLLLAQPVREAGAGAQPAFGALVSQASTQHGRIHHLQGLSCVFHALPQLVNGHQHPHRRAPS